jgi:hypothetical protein
VVLLLGSGNAAMIVNSSVQRSRSQRDVVKYSPNMLYPSAGFTESSNCIVKDTREVNICMFDDSDQNLSFQSQFNPEEDNMVDQHKNEDKQKDTISSFEDEPRGQHRGTRK